jgi:hypothetical protein
MLYVLPVLIDGRLGMRRGFSLASGANLNVPAQTVAPPFADCSMTGADRKPRWRHELPAYAPESDSIIALARTVLQDRYVQPLGFDDYRDYTERLAHIDYLQILELVEAKMESGIAPAPTEKARILDLLYYFAGVPAPLENYYNAEGRFLAQWLRKNCT